MLGDDNPGWKAFVATAIKNGQELLGAEHVGAQVQSAVKDLMQVAMNIETVLQNQVGQSADARVLKKRLDQAKSELRAYEQKTDAIKSLVGALVDEVKVIASESTSIQKRHDPTLGDPDGTSATKIKSSAHKIAEIIVKVAQT